MKSDIAPVHAHEPDLLVRPSPGRQEGPLGYLLRLAEANCMTLNDLCQIGGRYDWEWFGHNRLLPDPLLDPDLHSHVSRMSSIFKDKGRVWNQRHARCCPRCLSEDPTWRAGWELVFVDACPHHGVWLVDQCSSCGQAISWQRDNLLRCQCGSDLRQETPGSAPNSVLLLATELENRLLEKEAAPVWPVLAGLDLEQMQRLVRYLGGYMDPNAGPKPLKLRNAASMKVSWPVTTLAAEILAHWPESFQRCWSQMQDQAGKDKVGLKGAFKQAHTYLYKGLKEGAFGPVRAAFEAWLSEHWRGGLSKRNRNLTEKLLADVQWVPGKAAVERLGISMTRLRGLIASGTIEGQESVSTTGRRFVVVRRDQLEKLDTLLASEMTMNDAMTVLGLCKLRMRRLLKLLFPMARRVNDQSTLPWCVPRHEVELLLALSDGLPPVGVPDEGQVSVAHVLRFWAWTSDEIINLIEAVKRDEFKPVAQLTEVTGIPRWVFDSSQLKKWHARAQGGQKVWFSIPETAEKLGIKQEVAYWLTRNSYLQAQKLGKQKGLGSRIHQKDIDAFSKKYIFGRELAADLAISPRKLTRLLESEGFFPLSSQGQSGCRQMIYLRSDQLTERIGNLKTGSSGTGFQLVPD